MITKLPEPAPLFNEIKTLIDSARQRTAVAVNAELTLLYWQVGQRINAEILQGERSEYGKELVLNLAKQLTTSYGRGWSKRNLLYMVSFAQTYPDARIVQTLSAQLSWSHIYSLIYIKEEIKREFYTQMSVHERWSVRTLQNRMESMLFERTAISKKPEQTIIHDLEVIKNDKKISPDLTFRDPYFLDFLGLHDSYSEKDLESAILANLQAFITEMGTEFAFLARQKRITIDNVDYSIDLLFYHRGLRSLVAIDLKLGKFKAGYKGQMELYLGWLEHNEQKEGENKPVGLILCTEKSPEQIKYLMLDNNDQIKIAEYITRLPDKKLLEQKLLKAIAIAQNTLKK